jgi:TonB family protein
MTSLWNLAVYSLQLAALTAAACVALRALPLRSPRWSLRFWQAVALAALVLPLIQPRRDGAAPLISTLVGPVTSTSSREALAATGAYGAPTILLALLAAGVAVRLLWLGFGLLRIRKMIATATPDESLAPLLEEQQRTLGTHARLMVSADLGGPATVGVRRPVVLVPRSVLGLSPAVQRAIICHELVHVKRRDWLQTIAEELLCAVLWFHPAARVVASRLSLARETVVDEITILTTRDRRAYAEALLAFSDPQPHVIGVTPFIGRRTLSQRIAFIAQEGSMSRRQAFTSLIVALLASAGLTAATADRFPMSSDAQAGRVYTHADGITLPKAIHEVKPDYTQEAMQEKIQGSVWTLAVIGETGDVTDVTVTRSLDTQYGLDHKAVEAIYQWKFEPGTKDGKPVPVRVTIEVTFRLK